MAKALSPKEIQEIVDYYEICKSINSAAIALNRHYFTIQKYWNQFGLKNIPDNCELPPDKIEKILILNEVCEGNKSKVSRLSRVGYISVSKHLKKNGLNEGRRPLKYRGCKSGLDYFAHHEDRYAGLTRWELFQEDEGLYRKLSREGSLNRAIPDKSR
jgi:hypothetical protein